VSQRDGTELHGKEGKKRELRTPSILECMMTKLVGKDWGFIGTKDQAKNGWKIEE
jgi:hypothetical protein